MAALTVLNARGALEPGREFGPGGKKTLTGAIQFQSTIASGTIPCTLRNISFVSCQPVSSTQATEKVQPVLTLYQGKVNGGPSTITLQRLGTPTSGLVCFVKIVGDSL